MVESINQLQNPIEFDKYQEEYLIQALANLGQRIGIKGDGLAYKYFTFNDLLGDNISYNKNEYIGYIQYFNENNKNNVKFGVYQYDENGNLFNENIISNSVNINNILYFPNNLEFSIPVGNIEKYAKNSICVNDGNELTFMLAGKTFTSDNDEDLNTILYYYKYDIESNLLKYAAKLYHYYTNDNNEWFCLINTINSLYEESLKNINDDSTYVYGALNDEYHMYVKIFNGSLLKSNDPRLYNEFKKIFAFKNYENNIDLDFSIINSDYANIKNLLAYNENIVGDCSPIALINNYEYNSNFYKFKTITLKYNINNNEFLSVDDDYDSLVTYFYNEFNINFREELVLLNEDNIHLYFNIFDYYNNKYYFDSTKTFIKRILCKLYERILSNISDNEYFTLYIPLDYKFNYICNSNDNSHIYYSTNNYVTFINLDNINKYQFFSKNDNLICDYNSEISKLKTYNFVVNYNKYKDSLINSIDIKDVYTMPYINGNYNWSINDTDTKIGALGKDAGNPNIIIIFSIDKNDNGIYESFNVLNNIKDKQILNGSNFVKTKFIVNPALFDNIASNYNTACYTYIPTIDNNNKEYLANSIILSISTLDCLDTSELKSQYQGSHILTIWHLVEENGTYEYKCINEVDHDYALSLSSNINLYNATNDNSVANLNDQDLILLKAIISNVGHENLLTNLNNWLIIKNKDSEEYLSNTDIVNSYNNDLNGIVQFNDTVKLENNHIIYSQNNKYISSIDEIQVTNSLYPKYNNTTVTKSTTVNEVITELINQQSNNYSRESIIYVNGNEITNVESSIQLIEQELAEVATDSTVTLTIEELVKSNSNYDEYIFNSNVPTLDFGEVFNRNVNVLNRLNIISLDSAGNSYYAYFGTSYDEKLKTTLHLGTSNRNINIGTETLFNESDKNKFKTHDTLSLDFNNIVLNGSKIMSKSNNIVQQTFDNITFNILTFNMFGYLRNDYSDLFINLENTDFAKYDEQLNSGTLDNYNTIGLIVNKLLIKYFKLSEDYINNALIQINNDNNFIGVLQDTTANKQIVLFNKDSEISRNFNIINETLCYCGEPITIMYYESYSTNLNSNVLNIYISLK